MLLKARWGALAGAIAIVAYAACSQSDGGSANDAGVYGHERPIEASADLDEGVSDNFDAGNPGIYDAGPPPNPFAIGSWISGVQSLPQCSLKMAADPATVPGPLPWAACSSGHAGCQVMNANWSSTRGAKLFTSRPEPVRLVNGAPYLSYTRRYPYGGSYAALVEVIQPLRGNPVLAVGGEYTGDNSVWCVASAAMGDYGLAFVALGGDLTQYEIDWSPWATPTTFSSKILLTSAVPLGNQYGVGATDLALGSATLMDFATTTIHNATGFPPGAAFDLPLMVPAGAFVVEEISTGITIALLATNGAVTSIMDPTASSRSVSWLAVDRANSNALVWVESDSADFVSNPIIWTSPYATSAAGVTKTKVAAFQDADARGGADSVANAGVMLNLTGDTTALLTRLSDGMGWTINAEPAMYFVQPLWADDTEVWILASSLGPHDADQILRLQRSSMGSPTVSRGF